MRRNLIVVLTLLLTASHASAQRRRAVGRGTAPPQVVIANDFRDAPSFPSWFSGFADYSSLTRDMDLQAGLRPLPPELGVSGTGFFISGNNRSDDLFMFLARVVRSQEGIRPNQRYQVAFRIVFASNAGGERCGGIGGAPGLSVFMKAGASTEQPQVYLAPDAHYRLNVDKGNQATGGPAATVLGNISTGSSNCSDDAPFQTIARLHKHTFDVTSDAGGDLWLLVGTDSGFEGKTSLYYQSITATLTPVY